MMPLVTLTRLEEDEAAGTLGALLINGVLFGWVLEPPDRENAPNRSSIPAQQYACVRIESPRFGETFIVSQVPGRSDILFHPGNRVGDTRGCLLLGETLGKLKGDRALLNSGATFTRFLHTMDGVNRFKLTIRESY